MAAQLSRAGTPGPKVIGIAELGYARSSLRFELGKDGRELFLHQLIERRFLRAVALASKAGCLASPHRLQRSPP